MTIRSFTVAWILAITFSIPASAELTLCNEAPFSISTAVGYRESGQWHSRGWYNIEPGQCAVAVGGALANRYYYVHGYGTDGHTWGDDYSFCTKDAAFTITGQGDCAARGYASKKFYSVDTGNAQSYTSRLTCPNCKQKNGWHLNFALSDVPGGITVDGQSFQTPVTGRVNVDFSGRTLYAHLTVDSDLTALQNGLPPIMQRYVNRNDDCNEIINVHTISLAPQGNALRVYAAGHYEDWECPWTEVLGMRIDGGKHRIFEQDGDATILLTPQTNGDVIWMSVEVVRMNANGLLGELLRTDLFGPWIRDMILQSVPQTIQLGSIQQQLPPELRGFPIRLTRAAFYDRGSGRLGLRASATITVSPEFAETVWERLQ